MRIPSTIAHTGGHGNRNARITTALDSHSLDPWFDWDNTQTNLDDLYLKPGYLNGTEVFRIPFRIVDPDDPALSNGAQIYNFSDTWKQDISTTTIDLATNIGGLVDGLSLSASEDYLIWGFYDPFDTTGKFKGIGFTTLPSHTSATANAGATLGGTGIFTMTAGHGLRFNIGARVLIRQGTAAGSLYNQGIITAHISTTITVKMDADYSGAVSDESNASLASQSGLEVIQLDNFAPRMYNEDSLYPGGGAQYQFSYLGHFRTDSSSKIEYYRKRGKIYFPRTSDIFLDKTVAATTPYLNYCLCRWIPKGTQRIRQRLLVQKTAGAGSSFTVTSHSANSFQLLEGDVSTATILRSTGEVSIKTSFSTIYHSIIIGGSSTIKSRLILIGYYPDSF